MDARQEMATIVRDVIAELIGAQITVLTLNSTRATGVVSGRFRSGSTIYDYKIQGEDVSYRPLSGSAGSARADGAADRSRLLARP